VAAQGPLESEFATSIEVKPCFKDEDFDAAAPLTVTVPWHLRGALRTRALTGAGELDASAGSDQDGSSSSNSSRSSSLRSSTGSSYVTGLVPSRSGDSAAATATSVAVEHLLAFDPDLTTVSRKLPRFGITSYLPTVISSFPRVYRAVAARFRRYLAAVAELERVGDGGSSGSGSGGVGNGAKQPLRHGMAQVLGLHLEGPFISVKGAHDPKVRFLQKTQKRLSFRYIGVYA